ncbi:MAG: Coenzyme F420 hydrogenase/dehydrogenase, beta subunit C-terminal domain [Bacteroidales bacterium]|nr:Coenzyme F420 hydrogenase/dehydrogenase, beta subunit C-terminal domain [Bacteroidales bacterium]
MNISSRNAFRPCTSCQLCSVICPKQAITIKLDEEGFYRPYIDNNLCVDCGLCVMSCYKFDENIKETNEEDLENVNHYAASTNHGLIAKATTSGGIADILATHLSKAGYNVIGVKFDCNDNCAKHFVASSEQETKLFRGSKYIQSYAVSALRVLVEKCRNNKFAIFGLPCQIYSISKYLDTIDRRNDCILIDLYCHGCPSMLVWKKVSEKVRKKLKVQNFDEVIFRSKKKGWGKFVLEIRAQGKIYLSSPLHNEFYDLFFSNQVLNESCIDCKLRSTLAYTDIRLGDYWGPIYKKNKLGVSAVTLVTDNGQSLFNEISSEINSSVKPITSFLPYQSWGHKYDCNEELRNTIFDVLKNKNTNIKDAVSIINKRQPVKKRIKVLIKQLLFLFNINY